MRLPDNDISSHEAERTMPKPRHSPRLGPDESRQAAATSGPQLCRRMFSPRISDTSGRGGAGLFIYIFMLDAKPAIRSGGTDGPGCAGEKKKARPLAFRRHSPVFGSRPLFRHQRRCGPAPVRAAALTVHSPVPGSRASAVARLAAVPGFSS